MRSSSVSVTLDGSWMAFDINSTYQLTHRAIAKFC